MVSESILTRIKVSSCINPCNLTAAGLIGVLDQQWLVCFLGSIKMKNSSVCMFYKLSLELDGNLTLWPLESYSVFHGFFAHEGECRGRGQKEIEGSTLLYVFFFLFNNKMAFQFSKNC